MAANNPQQNFDGSAGARTFLTHGGPSQPPRPGNPYCIRSALYDVLMGSGGAGTLPMAAAGSFGQPQPYDAALAESISDSDLLHFADSIFAPAAVGGAPPSAQMHTAQLLRGTAFGAQPAHFAFNAQRLAHDMPAAYAQSMMEHRTYPSDEQQYLHGPHFPANSSAPVISAAPASAAAPAAAPVPAPAPPASKSGASDSGQAGSSPAPPTTATKSASTTKVTASTAAAKTRLNTHTGREPVITDFANPEDYQAAWMAWRQTRDANNEAVRRSRSAKRATLGCRNSTCLAMLTKLKSLHKTTALLLKASHNPQSLTRAERRNYRALLASVNAGNNPVALTVDALLAEGCDHDHENDNDNDNENDDQVDSDDSNAEGEADTPVQGPAPRSGSGAAVHPVK